jgi:hypothetical protein
VSSLESPCGRPQAPSGPQAIGDLLNGTNAFMFITMLPVVDLIRTARLRALAVTGPKRVPTLSDVPTIVEAGYPSLVVEDWTGFAVKHGTPKETVARPNAAINKALAKPSAPNRRATHPRSLAGWSAARSPTGTDAIKPAYGYRIEYQDREVVISGDTRYSANVLRYGRDADLLIHEVAMAQPDLLGEAYIQHQSPQIAAGSRPGVCAD